MGGSERSQNGFWRLLDSFARDRNGNIAILFVFMATVLFFFVGGAIDYSRRNAVRADMIESMDAAGLAVARLAVSDSSLTEGELSTYGQKFFLANFKHADMISNLVITFDLSDDAVIAPCVQGQLSTYLLRVVHIDKFKMDTCVEITKKGSGKVELALVLDVTGSMDWSVDGKKKIDSLKDAVDEMLQVMYGNKNTSTNIKIGVVPFNAYVNPGAASSWNDSWGDEDAEAYYHGAHFIHVDKTGTVDNSTLAKSYNSGGIAKVMDPTKKVNHYKLFNSDSDLDWAGCVEARPYPLDELDTTAGAATTTAIVQDALDVPTDLASPSDAYETRMKAAYTNAPTPTLSWSELAKAENSRFVPYFMPDEPDCSSSACNWGTSSVSASYSLGGTSRSLTGYGYYFDDPDDASGISENSYSNRSLISDYRFTKTTGGENFARYLDVVLGARMAVDENYADLDTYWDGVKARLTALGMDEISETVTSCSGKKKKKWKKKKCTTSATPGDEFILRNSYVGWYDSSTEKYVGKYNLSPSLYNGNPNAGCPAKILPLTNDRTKVEGLVGSLNAAGNTNSAIGTMWGWRVLSHQAPFTEGVGEGDADFDDWQKAIVIMTDGENTLSSRSTHWKSDYSSYGYAIEERMGSGIDSASEMRDEIDDKLLRICHRMKQEGYLVYTIMFDLNSTSVETMFKACATEPNAPYFYNADNGADLEEAFGNIAADLVDLHISK